MTSHLRFQLTRTQVSCRHAGAVSAALALLVAFAVPAFAQTWPRRPIRLIVPFAAAAPTTSWRGSSSPISSGQGQPIIIENKPAATGTVGTDLVAKAQPDGPAADGVHHAHVNPAVNAVALRHRARPRAHRADRQEPALFIVNPKVPAKTLSEFVTLAKQNPQVQLRHAGRSQPASAGRAVEQASPASRCSTFRIVAVPAVLGTVTGEVQLTLMSPMLRWRRSMAGLRLASGSAERDPHFPDLPTVSERVSGLRGGGVGRTVHHMGVPADRGQVNTEVNRIIRQPGIASKFDEQGTLAGGTPAEFGIVFRASSPAGRTPRRPRM
jgi:tripartite-type tricarboxylate transporter receptor subunit TctC